MKTAVIIVTFNGANWIQKCLNSVFSSGSDITIYVCDNGSSDNTLSILKAVHSKLVLIENRINIGFGAANNICLKKAYDDGCDFFLLINQDVYIQTETIPALIKILVENPEIGLVSPLHLNRDGTSFDKNFLLNLTSQSENKFVNDIYFERKQSLYHVKNVNAACWLLSRKTIQIVGGFDPIFFHYGEDENYCQRVLYHGMKIAITSDLYISHDRDERNGDIRSEFIAEYSYRKWLLKISNVFIDNELSEIKALQKRVCKDVIKSFMKFRVNFIFSHVVLYKKNNRVLKCAIEHKNVNRLPGLNWL